MATKDDNLMKRLLATFRTEAQEHIQAVAAGLLELERATAAEAQAAVLDTTFRAAHSLKGAARTVNARDIEGLCQSLESTFAALKRNEVGLSTELFDLLHRVVDALGKLLQLMDTDANAAQQRDVSDMIQSLQAALAVSRHTVRSEPAAMPAQAPIPTTAKGASHSAVEKRPLADTIRVTVSKLDAVLLQTEELLSAKLAATQQASRLRQHQAQSAAWKKKWEKLRPELRLVRQSLDGKRNGASAPLRARWAQLLDFLDANQNFLESLDGGLKELAKLAEHNQRALGAMVDNLHDDMKKVVTQPFATLLDVFPPFVRELSREHGKAVELSVRGAEIEIDRRILEEMKDPLIHLVRNCLDHGIEAALVRRQKGKPAHGTLSIDISARSGGNVELVVADDGAGIDAAAVRTAAGKLDIMPAERLAELSEEQARALIFQSGVSTSPIITDLSGRGLGLAIVKEKIEKLSGSLRLESQPGVGTTFRITLPLTLARFRGTLVRVDEHLFVVPTSNVERVMRVAADGIKTVENRTTVVVDGHTTALAQLADVLELPRRPAPHERQTLQPAVLLGSGQQRIAFAVDEVLNEQEVLVKSLGRQLLRVRNIAGATILDTGRVVPILSVGDLMKSAVRGSATRATAALAATDEQRKSVLVAEDSITSRILLKNILETAGYQVETAVDGIDAYTKLRSGSFDLMVSDVEMPRLDGFALTSKVRADKKFSELPVILVTALESREDREHGIDVGANAYIVKGSFDQSNLLSVIRRLI